MYDIDMNKDRPTAFSGQSGRQDSPMEKFIGKLRPQIFLSIIVLGVLSTLGVLYEYNEIATGCVGGIIALGMKVLENE